MYIDEKRYHRMFNCSQIAMILSVILLWANILLSFLINVHFVWMCPFWLFLFLFWIFVVGNIEGSIPEINKKKVWNVMRIVLAILCIIIAFGNSVSGMSLPLFAAVYNIWWICWGIPIAVILQHCLLYLLKKLVPLWDIGDNDLMYY